MAKEIVLDIREKATVKINLDNYIEYVDEYLLNVLGYKLTEFVTKRPKTICHPDMPAVIHETIGGYIMNYKEGIAVLKHATKSGNYIWAFTHFYPSYKDDGTFEAFVTRRKPLPNKKINGTEEDLKAVISRLYGILKEIEDHSGTEVSRKYLAGFLEEKGFDTLHDYYLSFFDFKRNEWEAYFQIDKNTSARTIRKYFSRPYYL